MSKGWPFESRDAAEAWLLWLRAGLRERRLFRGGEREWERRRGAAGAAACCCGGCCCLLLLLLPPSRPFLALGSGIAAGVWLRAA